MCTDTSDQCKLFACVCVRVRAYVLLMLQEGYREEADSLFPPSPCGQAALKLTSVHVTKTASLPAKLTMRDF